MTQRVGLKYRGKYIGCEPSHPDKVYANRTTRGAWEEIELTKRPDGYYTARFVAADVALSVDDLGQLVTRPAGTAGSWEVHRGAEMPPDWAPMVIAANGVMFEVSR